MIASVSSMVDWRICCLLVWIVACGHGQTAAVAQVEVSPAVAEVVAGRQISLSAAVSPAVGRGSFSWSSSNPLVATVSDAGLVTGISAGEATITATQDGKSGSAAITVDPGTLDIKGAWASFENVGWASGYANGETIKTFDSIQPQIAQQMDLMRSVGINAITFIIIATDATYCAARATYKRVPSEALCVPGRSTPRCSHDSPRPRGVADYDGVP